MNALDEVSKRQSYAKGYNDARAMRPPKPKKASNEFEYKAGYSKGQED